MRAQNPALHNQRGLDFLDRFPEKAEVEFRQCLALSPDFAEAHFHLGQVLAQVGRHEEAVASLREAIRLDRDDCAARELLAQVLEALGRNQQAAAVLGDLGALLVQHRCEEAAFAAFSAAERLHPPYFSAHARHRALFMDLSMRSYAMADDAYARGRSPSFRGPSRS